MLGTKEWHISREMPREPIDTCWTQCPRPQQGEIFLSWFTRIARANCADPLSIYSRLLGDPAIPNAFFTRIELLPKQKAKLIAKLESFVANVTDQLKNMPEFKVTEGPRVKNWNFLNIVRETPRFCPLCLKSDEFPFFRHNWHLPFMTVCPTHQILLRDCCPHCYTPVTYWNTAWNTPMTTCPNCLKILTGDEMFAQQLLSCEMIQFQQDLLDIYNTGILQGRRVEVQEFFQYIWRIAASSGVDPLIGEFSSNHTLSTERVHKALDRVLKAIQADGSIIQNPFINKIKTSQQIASDFQNIRTSGEYTPSEWEVAEIRYKTIKPLLGMGHRTALDVTNAGIQGNVSQKTVYNWMVLYHKGGVRALIPQNKKSGRRRTVYPPEVEDLCNAYFHRHLSVATESNPVPIRKFWIRFKDKCLSRGWRPSQIPRIGLFYKRYESIQENFKMMGRGSANPAKIETNPAGNSPL